MTEGQTLDRVQFLKDNKLSDVLDIFIKRDIVIEELIEFDITDLQQFATDIGLDILQKKRFIKAINSLKPINKTQETINSAKLRHIIISTDEHNAISKLYEQYQSISKLMESINNSFNILEQSLSNITSTINHYFDELTLNITTKQTELIKNSQFQTNTKQNQLTNQLETLQKYLLTINDTTEKYKQYQSNNSKINILSIVNSVLNDPNIQMSFITQPKLSFNIIDDQVAQFLNSFTINDCDAPLSPIIEILKIKHDRVVMKWNVKSVSKKILMFQIQWMKLPKSYLSDKHSKSKVKYSDSDTSNEDSDEKGKQTENKFEKLTEFELNDEMQWITKDILSTEKCKFTYTIKELSNNKAYAIRIRAQNDSGWSSFSIPIKIETAKIHQKWDKKYTSGRITINKRKITQMGDTGYSIACLKPVCSGRHHWKFRLLSWKGWLCIGIWDCKCDDKLKLKINQTSNYIANEPNTCYIFHCSSAMLNKYEQGSSWTTSKSYGVTCKMNDVVDMYLDLKKKTLSFSINKRKCGKAFTVKKSKYRAVINTHYQNEQIELIKYSTY